MEVEMERKGKKEEKHINNTIIDGDGYHRQQLL